MRDQIDQSRQDLERLDQQIGKRKAEVQLLQEAQDRKQQELTSVLHDAETEVASKNREIKDYRDEIDQLVHHKVELNAHLKTKRVELQKLKEEREQEEEVLQSLTNNINKNKSELKHTLEMQRIELTELENVKAQHAQKMVELEKTQRALLEEKSDLEQLNTETARKKADLERLRQAIDRDRQEVDHLNTEQQSLDDRIVNLTRDRNLLEENCKTLDDKLNNMKRNQKIMEEKIDTTNSRLEILDAELRMKERENEEAEIQRETMQREVSSLKQSIKEHKVELQALQESIREAEDKIGETDQDFRKMLHQRDEAKIELGRVSEQIRQSSFSYEEHSHQQKVKYQELQKLERSLAEREKQQQEAKMMLNKLREEVEKEENRLNRLVSNASTDLEMVTVELSKKQMELESMKMEYTDLQKKCNELQNSEEKVVELRKACRELEQGLHDRDIEKTELAKALSASYEEVQRLRQESSQVQGKNVQEQTVVDNSARDHHNSLQQSVQEQEIKQMENQPFFQVSAADKNFTPDNNLESGLSHIREEVRLTKKQSDKLSDDKENRVMTDVKITPLHSRTSISPGRPFKEYDWRNNALRERLAEERDYLRFHLQQQMLRHSEMVKSARLMSEETIDSLRWKLNNLQEVLYNTSPDIRALQVLARARSRSGSPGYKIGFRQGRTRSPSPLNTSGHSHYFAHKKSRSSENLRSPVQPGEDYL